MFGIDSIELLVVAVVAMLVIGPKDLPKVMRVIGQWMGRARGMARHFRSGIDTMMREAEMEEMEKKWKDENERIMQGFPPVDPVDPAPPAALADQAQLPLAAPPEGELPPPRDDDDGRALP